jgi:foldase protein PrsA
MKDKLKGLVVGLCLGTMLTGSIVYASGTQIEVYFNNLKYMFDGAEKKPADDQGKGFIYEGTTYVPLRFVSEALGKQVEWDGDTDTIWVGGKSASEAVATYDGGQVTKSEWDAYQSVKKLFSLDFDEQVKSDPQFKATLLKELVAYKIMSASTSAEAKTIIKQQSAQQLAQIKPQFAAAYGTDTTWEQKLAELQIGENNILDYIQFKMISQQYLASHLSDDKLMEIYNNGVKEHQFDIATVRHILVGLKDSTGKDRTKEDALKRTNEVLDKLKNGEDFTALAKQYSDDPGSKDNGGKYENANVNNWVSGFKEATIALPLNQNSDPVETQLGYHIIRVESRSTLSFDQVKEQLRNSSELLQQEFQDFVDNKITGLSMKLEGK